MPQLEWIDAGCGFSGPSAMGVIFDLTGGFTPGLFALAAVLLALRLKHRSVDK